MSVIKIITFAIAWALLGVTGSAPSTSLDPAPGRSPGPPPHQPPSTTSSLFDSALVTPANEDGDRPPTAPDLNLSSLSHEVNHISAIPRSSKSYPKGPVSEVTASNDGEIVNERLINERNNNGVGGATMAVGQHETSRSNNKPTCSDGGHNARSFVRDGETVVAASVASSKNDDGSSDSTEHTAALVLDVIHDVFDTTSEPLVADIVYKGKSNCGYH